MLECLDCALRLVEHGCDLSIGEIFTIFEQNNLALIGRKLKQSPVHGFNIKLILQNFPWTGVIAAGYLGIQHKFGRWMASAEVNDPIVSHPVEI